MRALALAFAGVISMSAQAQEPVRLHAAGSLRNALNEVIAAYSEAKVEAVYGASGLLRERIVKGEPAEVFASANMEHPRSLEKDGKAGPVRLFARNQLCALAAPQLEVSPAILVERMLDPAVKLGTSTPKADPSGDYAFELFRKSGHFEVLSRKALLLTGGPSSPPPPKNRNVYGMLVAEGKADIFLTYCTNALAAQQEVSALRVIRVPAPLAVGADYGLTVMKGARPQAQKFASYILSKPGQAILARHGFGPGDSP
jgi:molybdenum ABC transporter molybdate-binding protein